MKKVCIQVGHWNIENITRKGLRRWRSTAKLRRSTGASGERDWHWNEWMPRLRDKLIAAGVQVFITDAIWHDEIYNQDYDLWISGHYDGGGTENRCMISAPDPTVKPAFLNPEAQKKAEEFCRIWREIYPVKTGAINRDNRITLGMKQYYAFDYVPLNTPAVIIEHFNHTSQKGKELKKNPELVAQADFEAIMRFLGEEKSELERCWEAHKQAMDWANKEKAEKEKLQGELEKLRIEKETAGKQLSDLKIYSENLERKNKELVQENREMKEQLTDWQSVIDEREREISRLESKNKKLSQKIVVAEKRAASFKRYYEKALEKQITKATIKELIRELIRRFFVKRK